MPKHEAERARPPAHEARTHHPPTHPQRAAQPHQHPAERSKPVHGQRLAGRNVPHDRAQSAAKPPVRPAVMHQPDSASEQGHDIALLMKRGLISEKALGRSLPGYQIGGLPVPGELALVGETQPDRPPMLPVTGADKTTRREEASRLPQYRHEHSDIFDPHTWANMTADEIKSTLEAIAAGGIVGGVGSLAMFKTPVVTPAGAGIGAVIAGKGMAEHYDDERERREALARMQPDR